MKLGMNDMTARGFKVTEWILSNCVNYDDHVRWAHKMQWNFSAERV